MALVLIFAGSFVGVIVATIQMLLQDASFFQGVLIYLAFSLGVPGFLGLLAWSLQTVRSDASSPEDIAWNKA